MKDYLFLLGGKDLEMVEIRKILENEGLNFIDKDLSWGAKLSHYKEEIGEITEDKTIVGIELLKDMEVGQEYIEVDHHNQSTDKPSSIEQIAKLLDIDLNRFQRLVAANDKGYIDAMKDLEATKEEIEEVRLRDRRAQGVSREDERLARESIEDNKKIYGDLVVVKAKTDKFSPIADRLYPTEKLLIYTDKELTYYGVGARELGERYMKEYGEEKVYYGGGDDGYFGFGKGAFSSEKIEKRVEEVIEFGG
ncbi:hypothetical protein [Halonatronum saccharophilum]|uniref:hypothetical protein n=1 Tax=Halonatronum saccharophilum TaxID=150060 RepID=UPI0004B60E05|nr:hypothetical protein [Halonatronum saccharophilum]